MGEVVWLANYSKKQIITTTHLPFSKPGEWTSHPAAGILVSWYMLQNRGDDIRMVGDYEEPDELERIGNGFEDVAESVVAQLLEQGKLVSSGKDWQDPDDPSLFTLNLCLPPSTR